MTDKKTEALKLALKKAFDLGQRYWQQADSDFTSQWRKADVTLASFNQLVEDTIREALAEQPAQQQEPVYWQWRRKDQPWSLEYTFNSEVQVTTKDSERRALYTSPPASKPWVGLTEEQILNLVPGLQDCLCDPWDYNNSGDYYASIPKDMIRLARAIEAAHGIKEKNT